MTHQAADTILARLTARGLEGELFTLESHSMQVLFEDQSLSYVKEGQNIGYYLRVKDAQSRVGETSFTRMTDADEVIDSACTTAAFQKPAAIRFEQQGSLQAEGYAFPAIEDLSAAQLIDTGRQIVAGLRAIHETIKGPIFLQKDSWQIKIKTTSGAERSSRKTLYSHEIEGKISREGDLLQINHMYGHAAALPDIDTLLASFAQDYTHSQQTAAFSPGRYRVVLAPEVVEDLSRPLEAAFSGRNIEKKVSLLTEQMDRPILDPRLTIADDPTLKQLEQAVPFDDEGVSATPVTLVHRGVMSGMLLDKASAAALGASSNGRAFKRRPLLGGRTFRATVQPGLTNLTVSPGDTPERDMLMQPGKTIYIKSLMGTILGHHLDGVVSGNIWLGFLYENGECLGRIKDAIFNINIFDVLKERLAMIGDTLHTHRYIVTPMLVLEDIPITSK